MEHHVSKLSIQHNANGGSAIVIEGRLDADGRLRLQELVESCNDQAALSLDLSGLVFVDQDGQAYLCALQENGCQLTGASLYIKCLLDGGSV